MKICIIYGGTSTERDVSILSARSILNVFSNEKDIFGYDFDGDYNKLLENIKGVDLVFNSLHGGDGENGNNVEEFGIAFAVNENLSVSYNQADNEDDATAGTANVTEDSSGISAAYTMGSASFRIAINEASNVNGVSGSDDENMELSLKLSF